MLLTISLGAVISFYDLYSMVHPEHRRYQGGQFLGFAVGFVPLFCVLIWKGEFSFFDALKQERRISDYRWWAVPMIPALVSGIVSAIEYPQGYKLLFHQMHTLGFSGFSLAALGMSILTAICLHPAQAKWLSDQANWKWFVGLFILFQAGSDLVSALCSWLVRDDPLWENSMLTQLFRYPLLTSLLSAVLLSARMLLLMLWSRSDIRVASAMFFWLAVQNFLAPPRGSVAGWVASLGGLFLLWVAVGGMRQLQRSRAMVAQAETPEV